MEGVLCSRHSQVPAPCMHAGLHMQTGHPALWSGKMGVQHPSATFPLGPDL